jgi:hypothetical protein
MYKLGPVETILKGDARFPRVVSCEQCGESVGTVDSQAGPDTYFAVPAQAVVYLWPHLKAEVDAHERCCRGS